MRHTNKAAIESSPQDKIVASMFRFLLDVKLAVEADTAEGKGVGRDLAVAVVEDLARDGVDRLRLLLPAAVPGDLTGDCVGVEAVTPTSVLD